MVDNYWNPDGRGIRHMGNGKICFFPWGEYRGCRRFEADAMQPDAGNSGNPYMIENRMKVAENTRQPRMRQLRRAALPITGSPCTTRMQKAAGDRKMGEKLLILK